MVEIQSVQRVSSTGPSRGAGAGRAWLPGYVRVLRTADLLAITVAVVAAYLVRFGADDRAVAGALSPTYLVVSVVLVVVWFVALASAHVWDRRILMLGSGEYTAVFTATWRLFAVVAIVAYLAKMDVGRAFLAIAFPLGLALLLLERLVSRRWRTPRPTSGRRPSP